MNTRLKEIDCFKTTELALAATLIHYGYPLDCLEPLDGQRLNFIFLRQDGIDQIIQNFWADKLSVAPKRYFYILKELKSRVFSERRQYGGG